jgi:hypothetical protein
MWKHDKTPNCHFLIRDLLLSLCHCHVTVTIGEDENLTMLAEILHKSGLCWIDFL